MFIIEFDSQTDSAMFISYASIPSLTSDSQILQADIVSSLYVSASRASDPDLMDSLKPQALSTATTTFLNHQSINPMTSVLAEGIVTMCGVVTKKYKPVARKIKPVIAKLPKKYRIGRNIVGDPLETMPSLDPNLPPIQPTGRYTEERRDRVDMNHQDFLLAKEWDLIHDFMCKQNQAFAWNDLE